MRQLISLRYLAVSSLVQKEWNGFIHMLRVFLGLARRQGCPGLLSLSAPPSLSFLYQDHWLAEQKHIQLSETQTLKLSESLGWNTELVIYLLCCFSLGCEQFHSAQIQKAARAPFRDLRLPFQSFGHRCLQVCGPSHQHCLVSTLCHFLHLRVFFYSFFKEECDKKHLRWRSCYKNMHGSSAIWPWGFWGPLSRPPGAAPGT